LTVAIVLFGLGVVITCARFPPADAVGWIARNLGVPLGIPFLIAALLFGSVVWILRMSGSRFRLFRLISLIAAAASAVIGVFTISSYI
jgi:hypothetical protein